MSCTVHMGTDRLLTGVGHDHKLLHRSSTNQPSRAGRTISTQVSMGLRKTEMELAAQQSPVKLIASWLDCLGV